MLGCIYAQMPTVEKSVACLKSTRGLSVPHLTCRRTERRPIAACRQACHHRYGNSHTIWDHPPLPGAVVVFVVILAPYTKTADILLADCYWVQCVLVGMAGVHYKTPAVVQSIRLAATFICSFSTAHQQVSLHLLCVLFSCHDADFKSQ